MLGVGPQFYARSSFAVIRDKCFTGGACRNRFVALIGGFCITLFVMRAAWVTGLRAAEPKAGDAHGNATPREKGNRQESGSQAHPIGDFFISLGEHISSFAISPDSEQLGVVCGDGTVRIWDLRARKVVRSLDRADDPKPLSVCFSPESELIAISYHRRIGPDEIQLVDSKGNVVKRVSGYSAYQMALADHDRQLLIEGGRGVTVIEVATAEVIWDPEGGTRQPAVGSNGIIAIAKNNGQVEIKDALENKLISKVKVPDKRLSSIGISGDGGRLAIAVDSQVIVYDTKTDATIGAPIECGSDVHAVVMSPDGRFVASVDHSVKCWDIGTGAIRVEVAYGSYSPGRVQFSRDGRFLAEASFSDDVRIWDTSLPTGRTLPLQSGVVGVAWASDEKSYATLHGDGSVAIRDAATGNVLRQVTPTQPTTALSFVRPKKGGKELLALFQELAIELIDVNSAERVQYVGLKEIPNQSAVSPSKRARHVHFAAAANLVAAVYDDRIEVHDLSGNMVGKYKPKGGTARPLIAAIRPDGLQVAIVSPAGLSPMLLWEPQTGQSMPIDNVSRRYRAVAYSSDGRTIAASVAASKAPEKGAICRWNTDTRAPMPALAGTESDISQLQFTADGKTLYAVVQFHGSLGHLLAYHLDPNRERSPFDVISADFSFISIPPTGSQLITSTGADLPFSKEIQIRWQTAGRGKH